MVHPTPTLIPQLSFGLRGLPEHAWCSATKTFRALTRPGPVEHDVQYEGGWFVVGRSKPNTTVAKPPHPQQTSLSANAYPLPPTIAGSSQRQKQLNNLTPTPPATKSSVPAPTVCWNDHLRML